MFAGFDLDEAGAGPDLLLRRHRRLLRGARPPQHRVRVAVRPRRAEEALAPWHDRSQEGPRVEALYDAADDDSATGGPDLGRRIWPTVAIVDADGVRFLPDDDLARGSSKRPS
jgi:hypothetical protein